MSPTAEMVTRPVSGQPPAAEWRPTRCGAGCAVLGDPRPPRPWERAGGGGVTPGGQLCQAQPGRGDHRQTGHQGDHPAAPHLLSAMLRAVHAHRPAPVADMGPAPPRLPYHRPSWGWSSAYSRPSSRGASELVELRQPPVAFDTTAR